MRTRAMDLTAMRNYRLNACFGIPALCSLGSALAITAFALMLPLALVAQRAERPGLNVTGYVIDAELDTAAHTLTAKAVVSFTAPANLDVVNFGFHPALKVTTITDESGKKLEGERTADGAIRVTTSTPFVPGKTVTWTFVYSGAICTGEEDGPVEGLKLAAIQEPISYLLYAARWFPMTGYMTDRFTAAMHIRVPQGMRVFASGAQGGSHPAPLANGKPGDQYPRLQVGKLSAFPARLSPAAMLNPQPPAPAT